MTAISFENTDAVAKGDLELESVWLGGHIVWTGAFNLGDFPAPQSVPGQPDPALPAPIGSFARTQFIHDDWGGYPVIKLSPPTSSPNGPILGYIVQVKATSPSSCSHSVNNNGRSWANNAPEDNGFKTAQWLAYGRPADDPAIAIEPGMPDSSLLIVLGLVPGVPYEYRVAAYTAAGYSPWLNGPTNVNQMLKASEPTDGSASADMSLAAPASVTGHVRSTTQTWPGRVMLALRTSAAKYTIAKIKSTQVQARRVEWYGFDDKWEDVTPTWTDADGALRSEIIESDGYQWCVLQDLGKKTWWQFRARHVSDSGAGTGWFEATGISSEDGVRNSAAWEYPLSGNDAPEITEATGMAVYTADFKYINRGLWWEDAPSGLHITDDYYGIYTSDMPECYHSGSSDDYIAKPSGPQAVRGGDTVAVVTAATGGSQCTLRYKSDTDLTWRSGAALPFTGACGLAYDSGKWYISSKTQIYTTTGTFAAYTPLGPMPADNASTSPQTIALAGWLRVLGGKIWVGSRYGYGWVSSNNGQNWTNLGLGAETSIGYDCWCSPPQEISPGRYGMAWISAEFPVTGKPTLTVSAKESSDLINWTDVGSMTWRDGDIATGGTVTASNGIATSDDGRWVAASGHVIAPADDCTPLKPASDSFIGPPVWNGQRWITFYGWIGPDALEPIRYKSAFTVPPQASDPDWSTDPPGNDWWDNLPEHRPDPTPPRLSTAPPGLVLGAPGD